MSKLVLEITDDLANLRLLGGKFEFSPVYASEFLRALGTSIGFYKLDTEAKAEFLAVATLDKIAYGAEAYTLEFEGFAPITPPHVEGNLGPMLHHAWLSDAVVARVERKARGPKPRQASAKKRQGFSEQAVPLETLNDLADAVMLNWGNRCAITHRVYTDKERAAGELQLAVIRPVNAGGQVHVRNVIPMSRAYDDAFHQGLFCISDSHAVHYDMRHLGEKLAATLHESGRLWLPKDDGYRPDPVNLAYHRGFIYQG